MPGAEIYPGVFVIRIIMIGVTAFAGIGAANASEPAAAPPVPATATAAADPNMEMVCRKSKETGSLVKTKKRCHTKSQWAYIDEQNQKLGRNLVDETRGRITSQ